MQDYVFLAQKYRLKGSHPLLEAYDCSCEAAKESQYTPLFYARNKVFVNALIKVCLLITFIMLHLIAKDVFTGKMKAVRTCVVLLCYFISSCSQERTKNVQKSSSCYHV